MQPTLVRHEKLVKVPVDYTYIKNIKKPPGSPLGFVIFIHIKL